MSTLKKASLSWSYLGQYSQLPNVNALSKSLGLLNSAPFVSFFALLSLLTLLQAGVLLSAALSLYALFIIFNWDSRIIALVALLSLAYIPLMLLVGREDLAENLAVYAYFLLSATVLLEMLLSLRSWAVTLSQRFSPTLTTTKHSYSNTAVSSILTNDVTSEEYEFTGVNQQSEMIEEEKRKKIELSTIEFDRVDLQIRQIPQLAFASTSKDHHSIKKSNMRPVSLPIRFEHLRAA